jgi:tol-pal system protein YbgF
MNRSWMLGLVLLGAQQVSVAALFGEDVDNQARQEITDVKSEMEKQNKNIDKRINSLELGIKNLGLVEMVTQIEQLKDEIGKLRGQIELQTNQIETTQKRQRELYLDLDTRLRSLEKSPGSTSVPSESTTSEAKPETPAEPPAVKEETKPAVTMAPATPPAVTAPPPVSTTPTSPPPTAVVTPKPTTPPKPTVAATSPKPPPTTEAGGDIKSYEEAHKIFRSGNYQGAVNAFRGFIEQFPSSLLASNAQYWIGISFYNLKDLKAALGSHQQLLKRYPDSPKVPDSMLNIATIQSDLNDPAAAKTTLEDIVAKYPSSEAATKARSRLAKRP